MDLYVTKKSVSSEGMNLKEKGQNNGEEIIFILVLRGGWKKASESGRRTDVQPLAKRKTG